MVKLIGLVGGAMTGKTTAAVHIIEYFTTNLTPWKKYSFANPLKEMIYRAGICGWDELYVNKTDYSRQMLQLIGTNLVRCQIDPEYWNKIAHKEILCMLVDGFSVVVDDVRFHDEAALIRSMGGKLIKLQRKGFDNNRSDINPSHFSEGQINSIDCESVLFVEDGDLDTLKKEVTHAVKLL